MSHEQEDFELVATAVELSQLGKLESMPSALRAKLEADAARALATGQAASGGAPGSSDSGSARPTTLPRPSRTVQLAGWFAAAACLVVAATSFLRAPREVTKVVTIEAPTPPAPKVPTIAEQREALRKAGKDVVEIGWSTTKDPAAQGATGNVVWSTSDQRGYMHFHGLAPNDRSQSTYQLWIFDKERDAKYPVDGGTFDIESNGDVIVPIAAKIHVNKPALFAVTVEKPGGVVVSKRERIVVTAAVN
jgi:hypothetical protein